MQRKPSHFGSYCHSLPTGSSPTWQRLHRRVFARYRKAHITLSSLKRPRAASSGFQRSPSCLHARGHVVDAEVRDLHTILDLLPRHRRRHGGFRCGSRRVHRRERSAPRILVVVHEHASARSLRNAVLGRDQLGRARLHHARELLGERPDLLLQRAAHDRHVDVNPARSRGLRERRHAERFERLAHEQRGVAHAREAGAHHGIEIEVQVVRTIHVVAARIPLIEIDAAEVDHPEQRREILHHRKVDDASRSVLDRARLDPVRPR